MKKLIKLLGSMLTLLLIFFNSNIPVNAQDEVESVDYREEPIEEIQYESFEEFLNKNPETQEMFNTLDLYLTKQENGGLSFDFESAFADNVDSETIEVGLAIHSITQSINEKGFNKGLQPTVRALFPIGSYGNYCGKGNKGMTKKPIDDLDSACRAHDRCFKGFNSKSKACNRAFVKRLMPIVQKNKGKTTYKAVYARAAMKLFSKNM